RYHKKCRSQISHPDSVNQYSCCQYFFFFQAEDGIRDGHVTGVQTCALPILLVLQAVTPPPQLAALKQEVVRDVANRAQFTQQMRSEERRVGKECRSRWAPEQ